MLETAPGEAFAYFQPAKAELDDWMRATGGHSSDGGEVPRRITQYWDTQTPPQSVRDAMENWRSAEGFDHRLFDRQAAEDFLLQRLGESHLQAFLQSNSTTEGADFLRLCLLWVEGGVYADADDRLMGDLSLLLEEVKGCLLLREPFGAIANNLIAAPPEHPIIGRAMEMAHASLLARENDNTWAKTGPGLMTRAVATCIRDIPDEISAAGLSILPQHAVSRFVSMHLALPYKATPEYWNWQGDERCPEEVRAVLDTAVAHGSGQRD